MNPKTSNRIALLLGKDLGYSRRVLTGILDHVESQKIPWFFHHAPPDIRTLPALERWQPDGIILYMWEQGIEERLRETGVPIVAVRDTSSPATVPCVDVNNEEVGRIAADYFLGLGHRTFAYYGSRHTAFSINREKGFRSRLESLGYQVSSYCARDYSCSQFGQDWNCLDRETKRWLKDLPKPVAIFASNDIPAQLLCEACGQFGISVPDEVSILGVDNDTYECRMCTPSLSSIEVPAEQIGGKAVDCLFELLKSKEAPAPSVTYLPPMGVITRGSTDHRATCDERLKEILDYIEETAEEGTTVVDICRYSGLSRRSIERLFKSELDTTVYQRIQEARMTRAKRLLLESDLTIDEVAKRSGFGNTRRLDRAFTQTEGVSPTAYRNE